MHEQGHWQGKLHLMKRAQSLKFTKLANIWKRIKRTAPQESGAKQLEETLCSDTRAVAGISCSILNVRS
jgi:hypothetical protein